MPPSKKAKALAILDEKLKSRKVVEAPILLLPKPTVINIRGPPPASKVEKKGKNKGTKSISTDETN